jgi:hypothetical protein
MRKHFFAIYCLLFLSLSINMALMFCSRSDWVRLNAHDRALSVDTRRLPLLY